MLRTIINYVMKVYVLRAHYCIYYCYFIAYALATFFQAAKVQFYTAPIAPSSTIQQYDAVFALIVWPQADARLLYARIKLSYYLLIWRNAFNEMLCVLLLLLLLLHEQKTLFNEMLIVSHSAGVKL